MNLSKQNYTRFSPFIAKIKLRKNLCSEDSSKKTLHIVIDLEESGISYEVGDCVGIYPVNDPLLLELTLSSMKASAEEMIVDPRTGEHLSLHDFLSFRSNVTDVSRKLLKEILDKQSNETKKLELETLLKEPDHLKQYLYGKHLWDLLSYHHEATFSAQELCDLLMPLLPRYYSIASSPKVAINELHLTVRLLSYEAHGYERKGVCTHYLCNLATTEEPIIPLFIHPHKGFTLPEDPTVPIIMVGPGTGVAPFRAFMQERMATNATGKNWLFFGEWHREHSFLYGDFWQELEREGKLKLDLAFSRDQEFKIYVQDLLLNEGQLVFEWLEAGAYFYVCGDSKNMAKEVDNALQEIVKIHGNMTEEQAKNYIKQLRKDKRYLRDVY